MINITNGYPEIYALGTDDKSLPSTAPRPIILSNHVPLVFLFAAKGPEDKVVVDGAIANALYGDKTFNRKYPYFKHTTRLLERVLAGGSTAAVVRIVPEDNKKLANAILYLDVLKDKVNVYKRHVDGSIAYDENGDPIVDKEDVDGLIVKPIIEYIDIDENYQPGTLPIKEGTMEDGDGNKSSMYPIMELVALYKGEDYNNFGLWLELPTPDSINREDVKKNLALTYNMGVARRPDRQSSPENVRTIFGTEFTSIAFKDNARTNVGELSLEPADAYKRWYNLTNPMYDIIYPDIRDPYVYYSNLDIVLKQALELEKPYIGVDIDTVEDITVNTSTFMDFLEDEDIDKQSYILNLLTCESTYRAPYFTIQLNTSNENLTKDQKVLHIGRSTPIMLDKGEDGSLTEEELEKGVVKYIKKYLDKNSEVQDPISNPENVLYDSGFTLETKKILPAFIGRRKDTVIILSTREDRLGYKKVDIATQRAIGLALKTKIALYPESTYFGTPVTRAGIVVGSGIDELDPLRPRRALTIDVAYKLARFMSGDKWKPELMPDSGGNNLITDFSDIDPSFIPQGIKPDLWNIGLIWPQKYNDHLYCIPQMQSVYDKDMSALNTIFMPFALSILNKVAAKIHIKYSGNIRMKPNELLTTIENEMNEITNRKLNGVYKVVNTAEITDLDKIRGYSWTVKSTIYGEVMKTAMTYYIEARRA